MNITSDAQWRLPVYKCVRSDLILLQLLQWLIMASIDSIVFVPSSPNSFNETKVFL